MSDLSKQFISSIPITHMSRPQWVQFKDAIERLHSLEEENGRLKDALKQAEPQRKRLNNGQCAAQIVDCDCRWCRPEPTPTP